MLPVALTITVSAIILTSQSDRSIMKRVQASAAKAHFSELLDEVARGETIIITRHGEEIATLAPSHDYRERDIRQAMADIEEMRKHAPRVTREEILAWRDEGRK
jgi:prevent-host-death family protein